MKSRKNAGVEIGDFFKTSIAGRVCGISLLMLLFLFLMPKVSFARDQLIPEVRLFGSPTSINAGTLPDPGISTTTEHVRAKIFRVQSTIKGHVADWQWWNEEENAWDDFRVGKKSDFNYYTPIAKADGTRYGLKVTLLCDKGYFIDESTKIYFNNQEYNSVGKTELSFLYIDPNVILDLGTATGTANLYTIDFETKGGTSIPSQTVEEGHLASLTKSPKKDGHSFLGWYLDEEGTRKFEYKNPIQGNMTLYAKWRVNKLLP